MKLKQILDDTPVLMVYMDHIRFTASRSLVLGVSKEVTKLRGRGVSVSPPYCSIHQFDILSVPFQAREGILTKTEREIMMRKPNKIFLSKGEYRVELL